MQPVKSTPMKAILTRLSRRLVQVLSGLVLLIVSFYYARAFVSRV